MPVEVSKERDEVAAYHRAMNGPNYVYADVLGETFLICHPGTKNCFAVWKDGKSNLGESKTAGEFLKFFKEFDGKGYATTTIDQMEEIWGENFQPYGE